MPIQLFFDQAQVIFDYAHGLFKVLKLYLYTAIRAARLAFLLRDDVAQVLLAQVEGDDDGDNRNCRHHQPLVFRHDVGTVIHLRHSIPAL